MNTKLKAPLTGVWLGVGLTILLVAAMALIQQRSSRPPLPVLLSVGSFNLTNQLGENVTAQSLRGQVWVANIIFTRCPGPCLKLSRQFKEAQDRIPTNAPVRFVSLTADPVFDTPAVLREYAGKFQAEPRRWWFLTGPKTNIYEFATAQLKLAVIEKENSKQPPDPDSFIHSEKFAVVDGQSRVRAYIEGGEMDTSKQIVETVLRLLEERRRP